MASSVYEISRTWIREAADGISVAVLDMTIIFVNLVQKHIY